MPWPRRPGASVYRRRLSITGQQTFAGEVTPTAATDADGDAVLVTLQRNADHPTPRRTSPLSQSPSTGLRLVWSEWRAPAGARRPTHSVVLTQQLRPDPGRVVRLARLASTVTQGFTLVAATAGPDGAASVLWQGKPAGSPEADAAGVAVFTDGTLAGRTVLPGTAARLRYLGLPTLAATPGGALVGWSLTGPTSPRGDATVGVLTRPAG